MTSPQSMHSAIPKGLQEAWQVTRFPTPDLSRYARGVTLSETRRGLGLMSLAMLALLVAAAALYSRLGLGLAHLYTCTILAVLATHVYLSAQAVRDQRALYLLGMTLLVLSATAFVLLAQRSGAFDMALFASVALLFIVIPVVPWGLREALTTSLLIYGLLTASTTLVHARFDREVLWTLQFVMLGSGLVALLLVARNTQLRRGEIRARFDLERARDRLQELSFRDPLTGAWNRRYLAREVLPRVAAWHRAGRTAHFALLDLDDFKPINDTYGHEVGDQVLQGLSRAFQEALGGDGVLVRMGGDEFALLYGGERPEGRIATALAALQGVPAAGLEALPPISLSIGLVSLPPGTAPDQGLLYRTADEALYAAKAAKRPAPGGQRLVRRPLPTETGAPVTAAGSGRHQAVAPLG